MSNKDHAIFSSYIVLKPLNHKAHQRPHTVHLWKERKKQKQLSLNSKSSEATKQKWISKQKKYVKKL